ncbi:hypothetical protein GCM10027406_22520 [Leifsonia lichenia]
MGVTRVVRLSAFAAGLALAFVSAASGAEAAPAIVSRVTDATADGPVVVAIGDSIMEGHGLDPSDAWPALLAGEDGWRLSNLASDGSGFVTVGDNGDTFADQVHAAVSLHPSVVIVSGSSNDLGEPDAAIARATDSTLTALRAALPHAEILAVSPVWSDTAEPDQLRTIDADVVKAAGTIGAVDLDIGQPLDGQRDLLQADDVHPTAAGQAVIAAAVERALGRPAA